MAKKRTGAYTALLIGKTACRILAKYGKSGIAAKLGLGYASALEILAAACLALELTDDYVLAVDRTEPKGAEDE